MVELLSEFDELHTSHCAGTETRKLTEMSLGTGRHEVTPVSLLRALVMTGSHAYASHTD